MPYPANDRRDLFALLIAGATLMLTAFVLAPAQLFLLNDREVSIALMDVIRIAWRFPLGLAALVAVIAFAGRPGGRRVAASVMAALALMLYLQGNVLVRDYGVFDGNDVDWDQHHLAGLVAGFVWLAVLTGSVIFHSRWRKRIPLVCALLLLLHLGTIGFYLAAGRSLDNRIDQAELAGLFEFSDQQNVLFILLDGFPAPTFDQLLALDDSLAAPFEGFTYYRNTAAVSPYTLLSIPSILSGRVYDNSQTIREFNAAAFGDQSLPRVMQRNGYRAQLVTAGLYGSHLAGLPYQKADTYGTVSADDATKRDALKIWDVTLFRYAPHFLKPAIYRDHAWFLQRHLLPSPSEVEPATGPTEDDAMRLSAAQQASERLWDRLVADAAAGTGAPTFKFLHFFTSHPPYLLNADGTTLTRQQYQARDMYERCRDQCAYTLARVRQLLDTLRDLDVLDRTLVVILADHGSNAGRRGLSTPINRGLPLLMIRPIAAAGPLRTTRTPASLLDLPATVAAALGLDCSYPGLPLLNPATAADRARPYFYFTWEKRFWQTDYIPLLTEYQVIGPTWERGSWREIRSIEGGGP